MCIRDRAGRDSLLAILDNVAVQVKKLQDPETGGWYQVDVYKRQGQTHAACPPVFYSI